MKCRCSSCAKSPAIPSLHRRTALRSQRRTRQDDSGHSPRVPRQSHGRPARPSASTSSRKATTANEDLVHRPGASTFDSNIGMQYGYDTVPHLARVDITGPYNATGPGDTPSRRRIFLCHPTTAADEIPCARRILSNMARRAFRRAPTDNDLEISAQLLSAGTDAHRKFRNRHRNGPAPHPRRSRIRLPLRTAARQRSRRPAVSHQRHRTSLAPVVLPLVEHPRRRAPEPCHSEQAARTRRPRARDAPHAGRSTRAISASPTSPANGSTSAI